MKYYGIKIMCRTHQQFEDVLKVLEQDGWSISNYPSVFWDTYQEEGIGLFVGESRTITWCRGTEVNWFEDHSFEEMTYVEVCGSRMTNIVFEE